MKRLAGKVALITGAGSGIGRAQALRFAGEGCAVVVSDLNPEAADQVAADVREQGGNGMPVRLDVTDPASARAAVDDALRMFGKLDILSNTAGMADNLAGMIETTPALWHRILSVNLTGMFNVTQAVLPAMLARGSGVVLNIASGASFRGGMGGISYTSAKHGVVGFTRQLTAEFGRRGIRAIGIAPGLIDTPMAAEFLADSDFRAKAADRPAGRVGTPADIANAALFLVSDESDYIHGVTLAVDGGRQAVA